MSLPYSPSSEFILELPLTLLGPDPHQSTYNCLGSPLANLSRSHPLTFPNSSISSQVGISDHTPLLLQLSSTIPKASTFHFENSWLLHADFLLSVLPAWHAAPASSGAVASLAAGLKAMRREAKLWAQHKCSPPRLHHNCKFLICLNDVFEEGHLLSQGELHL
jgi:hypothetical protein